MRLYDSHVEDRGRPSAFNTSSNVVELSPDRETQLRSRFAGEKRVSSGADPDTNRYAGELKAILSSLAEGQSLHNTPQRIVVAGVRTGADASMVARGLATTCAASGFRVLLVDADIEHPTVHRDFGISNEFGLTDLLSSSDSPHRLAQQTGLPNLAVITAGFKISNFASLLARERLFHRLQPISHHFDYIIADAGTLSPALVGRISADADSVVVAVKEHVSSIREVNSMLRSLQAEAGPEPAILMIE